MKKLFLILAILFLAETFVFSSLSSEREQRTVKVGEYSLNILKSENEFFLSGIVYPKQNRNVVVSWGAAKWIGEKSTIEYYYPYIRKAYKDWREAANVYLPEQYRLPELSFTSLEVVPHSTRKQQSAATFISFDVAGYEGKTQGEAYSYFSKTGEGSGKIKIYLGGSFSWYEEKAQGKQPSEKARQNFLHHACRLIPEDECELLENMQPEKWHKIGPWMTFNQKVITHEFGHLLGLGHDNSKNSIMEPEIRDKRGSVKPTSKDGWNLALLTCWYHNRKAKKEVCVPVNPADSDKLLKEVRDSITNDAKKLKGSIRIN